MEKKLQRVIEQIDGPFFFYNLDALVEHLEDIRSQIDGRVKLWYACKANPMSAILKVLRNLGFGIDVASTGELEQVLRIGIGPEAIIATGPAKSKSYLKMLLKRDVQTIVIESPNQLKWLDEASAEMGKRPDALIRVQLDWEGGKSLLGGNEITPFGVDQEQWKKLNFSEYTNVNIIGLHAFQWGNILDLTELKKIWFESAKRLTQFAKDVGINLQVLDLGGGVGIDYDHNKSLPKFSEINEILSELIETFDIPKVWLEFGRYTIGPFGEYFTRVVDRKIVRGKNLLVTEGGINHISRPALTGQSFPCKLHRNSQTKEKSVFQVHGPLCTALDKLGEFSLPSDVEVGDWLVFEKTGAYGFTESMPYFLCHDTAAEVTFYKGDMMIPRTSDPSRNWLV